MGPEEVGLVADVGRVSVRFGLTGGRLGLTPREVQTYHTADHPTFTSALSAYLKQVGCENEVLPSTLAIAGAVRGEVINMTGSRSTRARISSNEALPEPITMDALNSTTGTPLERRMLPVSRRLRM